jgi:acetyltransferase-like isoleucine patch superfamily enzyme
MLKHVMYELRNAWRSLILKCRFPHHAIVIHPTSWIGGTAALRIYPSGSGNIRIGKNCWIEEYSRITTHGGDVEIGDGSSVNDFTVIRGGGGVRIGNCVRIGPHCVLIGASHKYDRTDIPIGEQGLTLQPVIVEDGVWIGANCTVLCGVTVGEGSIIGAGSVVTRSIPPYTVAVGNPAKVTRDRKADHRRIQGAVDNQGVYGDGTQER